MNSLFYLIPMSLLLLAGAVWLLLWALRRGQYDDLDSPAQRVIFDDREERADTDKRTTDD